MGLFKKRPPEAAADAAPGLDADQLRAELAAMSARLDAADASKQQLNQLVHDLGMRLSAAEAATVQEVPVTEVKAADLDLLRARVQRLADRLDAPPISTPPPPPPPISDPPAQPGAGDVDLSAVDERLARLADRLDQVDLRVTSIATELANQITELSGDIEAGDTAALAEELRDAQARLANEQARYQIAFRQDLADLATRLKKS